MTKQQKEVARYIILTTLGIGAYYATLSAYNIENTKGLSNAYAGVVSVYLGTFGYIVKWFFDTKIDDNKKDEL